MWRHSRRSTHGATCRRPAVSDEQSSLLAVFAVADVLSHNFMAVTQCELSQQQDQEITGCPCSQQDTRAFFTATAGRIFTPFREVTWADFLLADFLTSLAKPISDTERALCHMLTGPIMDPSPRVRNRLRIRTVMRMTRNRASTCNFSTGLMSEAFLEPRVRCPVESALMSSLWRIACARVDGHPAQNTETTPAAAFHVLPRDHHSLCHLDVCAMTSLHSLTLAGVLVVVQVCSGASFLVPAAWAAPFVFRFCQCIRVWADTGATPQVPPFTLHTAFRHWTAIDLSSCAAASEHCRHS